MKIKKFLIAGLVFLLAINVLIVVTDHSYLYKGVLNTYLKGRKGPGIFDLGVFESKLLQASNPTVIPTKKQNFSISEAHQKRLKELQTNSFLLLKNDSLVSENYWGSSKETTSNSFSVAKSVVGILIGIAQKQGLIHSIKDPVAKYLPHFKQDKLNKITLYHLLSMSSGLYWIESGANPLSHNAKAYYGSNLTKMVNNLKYEKEPGIVFEYKSGNSQVLAEVIQAATGMSVSQYAEKYLWKKIGAQHDAFWSLDSENGTEKAFCCLYATARDFAKIGSLMLHTGNVNGEQLMDTAYVYASTLPTTLLKTNGNINDTYGLHWWIFNDYQGLSGFYARGILGQYIIVIPNEKLVMVRTGHQRMGKTDGFHPDDLYLYLDIAKDFLLHEKRY